MLIRILLFKYVRPLKVTAPRSRFERIHMHCKFFIEESKGFYTATANTISGTITLSSNAEIKDIKTISYGVKVQTQFIREYKGYNAYMPARENTPENEWRLADYHRNRIKNDVYICEVDLIDQMVNSNQSAMKKFKFSQKDFSFPTGVSVASPIQCEIKPPNYFWLPSSNDLYEEDKLNTVHPSLHVKYYVYVRVKRISTLMKRIKYDEYLHPISYIGECQFKPLPGFYKHTVVQDFINKKPKPELIDNESGCFEGMKLNDSILKTKMLTKIIGSGFRGRRNIPMFMYFTANTLIDINKPLSEQISLKLSFDLSNFDFPMDFQVGKRSTGLGLFEIYQLELFVSYEIYNPHINGPYALNFQRIYSHNFKGLIFDMRDLEYDPKSHTAMIQFTNKMLFLTDNEMNMMDDCLPFFTSCKLGKNDESHTVLKFLWKVADNDERVSFEFITKCSITG